MFAKEIWDYDNNKVGLIKNYDYNLEIVWESDLKYSNNKIINILNEYARKNNSNIKK